MPTIPTYEHTFPVPLHARAAPPVLSRARKLKHPILLFLFTFLCLWVATTGSAYAKPAKQKFKLRGEITGSYEVRNRIGPGAKAKLRLRTRREKKLRSTLQLQGQYFRNDVSVKDIYVDYKFSNSYRLEFGVNKKVLGLEYEESSRERLSPKRSLLYSKMEVLGLVGRQLNLRLQTKPTEHVHADITLGTDGNYNSNLAGKLLYRKGNWGLGSWGLFELHNITKPRLVMPIWSTVASVWYQSTDNRMALEVFGGVDSFASEIMLLHGNGEQKHFAGGKLEFGHTFAWADDIHVEPFGQVSLLWDTVSSPERYSVQAVLGSHLYLSGFRVSGFVDLVRRTDRSEAHRRSNDRPNAYVSGTYFF